MAGIFGLFFYLKKENYESVFQKDKHEINLVRITIPKTEKISWEEKNEFVYQGNHYDVFSQSSDEKNYYFLCHHDTEENALCNVFTKHLTNQFDERTAGKGDGSQNNIKVILQDFIFESYWWQIEIPFAGITRDKNLFALPSDFCCVFSPPPEIG